MNLPIVNVDIEILYFFWFCPILLGIIFLYLHLNIILLRDIVDEYPGDVLVPAFLGKTSYWVINVRDLGLGGERRSRLLHARRVMSYFVVSAIVPFICFILFFRSLTAHNFNLSLFTVTVFLSEILIGILVWAFPKFQFFRISKVSVRALLKRSSSVSFLVVYIACTVGIASYAWIRSVGSPLKIEEGLALCDWGPRPLGLAPIDIREASIAQKPADWLPRFIWVEDFLGQFLSRGRSVNAPLSDDEMRRFEEEWFDRREAYLSRIARPDLTGVDLRGAIASDAFMAKVILSKSDLTCIHLERANLEAAVAYDAVFDRGLLNSANLEQAQMKDASFRRALLERTRLDEAYLPNTTFSSANLYGAKLNAAFLREANFTNAILEEASLQGAFLRDADLRGARLRGANLGGAILWGADLSTAQGLTQVQIDQAVGDVHTKLPAGLTIKGCWMLPLPDLPRLIRRQWWFGDGDVMRAAICPKTHQPTDLYHGSP